ncbi:hypothetical protein RIF29_27501 [Crotalaria pallida]|uniref:Deubiquitinating enzyme A n=1 Tax=Crotalaria pallida TaxID=3830 RepID=A0AAN9ERJ5_CROPI
MGWIPRRCGSSLNPNNSEPSSAQQEPQTVVPSVEESGEEVIDPVVVGEELLGCSGTNNNNKAKSDDPLIESFHCKQNDITLDHEGLAEEFKFLREMSKEFMISEKEKSSGFSLINVCGGRSHSLPPLVLPQKLTVSGWHDVLAMTSSAGSRSSSPRAHNECEGYNSADEHNPCLVSSYHGSVNVNVGNYIHSLGSEQQFEIDIKREKGYEVKRMLGDGNCLFRAVADQVYGDSELYDLVRQKCIAYMEQERDHFSQFITEDFESYCTRKRRDKVFGNNVEIQAICDMYNRPIHIYSYTTEPINTFHGSTDTPPIRLSYHDGNHYNSLVDPHCSTIGVGLGSGCFRGTSADKDQVKSAIKAEEDQQINNATEGTFRSDIELTEMEIEHAVMEASQAEYFADEIKQQLNFAESSASNSELSASGGRPFNSDPKLEEGKENDSDLSSSVRIVMSMGFSDMQAIEAYSIFGDDVDSMVCYLLEGGNSSSQKRKAI